MVLDAPLDPGYRVRSPFAGIRLSVLSFYAGIGLAPFLSLASMLIRTLRHGDYPRLACDCFSTIQHIVTAKTDLLFFYLTGHISCWEDW